jgi:hypothetical protein
MSQLEFLFKQHETILSWYYQAESKGTLLHAINGALVAALNGLVFVGADKFREVHVTYGQGLKVLLVLTSVCVVASYLFMLKAVWARHHGRQPPLTDRQKLWFFGHVAAIPRETYERLLDPFDEHDIVVTMLAQNHILSRNVATKFDALNWAISLTIAGIVLFFILGMVYALAVAGA